MTVTPPTTTADAALDRLRRQDAGVPEPGDTLSIAEAAELTGLTAHTLRYYERIGLLHVGRDAAGYTSQLRPAVEVARIVFISRLRVSGMPIRHDQPLPGPAPARASTPNRSGSP